MPEEEGTPPEPEKKKNLLSSWKGLAGWQKAGVLIGGAALAFAIYSSVHGQSAPTGNDGFAGLPNEQAPGFGDQFPSVPVPPAPTPAPAPSKPGPALPPVARTPVARTPAPVARTPVARKILPASPPKRSIILQPPLGGPRGRL